ncbi:MAG: NAD(P)/FAD-dependent oxidoreductase [Alphaproteobacteria bacterium]|nr:MAG: NAD(P)/FAD-dependent oxidoreductase [Alphaproteobacteria bacterium]
MARVDTLVIGAGVIGLAVARALALAGREVVIVDAADAIGTATSSRNSEVIHAGIHYPPGSLKARSCVRGRDALYAYCAARGIAHRRCGKLIVATAPEDEARLGAIAANARANGVAVEEIDGAAARAMEPALDCVAALHVPVTGIVDSHGLMLALLADAEAAGAVLALRTPVVGLESAPGGFSVWTGGADPARLDAAAVVIAAGHEAPVLGRMLTPTAPARFFAKGSYFALRGRAPFSRLIYPVPVPGGLGTHLTLDLAGRARFGPDVEWVDAPDHRVDPARAARFAAEIRRWWPGLPDGALHPDQAGVRPKIAGPGEAAADFRADGAAVHGLPGLVALYGIESPGLTAALALADHVRDLMLADLGAAPRGRRIA